MTKRPHGRFNATLAMLALMLATSPSARAGDQNDQGNDDSTSKIQRGLAIAPVPLNLAGRNRALVAQGSYLVNGAGDCNGCVGSSRVDLQACKLEYSIVSPK